PFRDDPAVAQHQAVRSATRPHWAERLVPRRLLAEIAFDDLGKVASPRRLVLSGIPHPGGNRRGIEPGRFRCGIFPGDRRSWWKIGHIGLTKGFRLDFRRIGTT